jgi:hypothetical protein
MIGTGLAIISGGKSLCVLQEVQHQAKGKDMKKQMLDIAIVLTILLATGGSALATPLPPPAPDNCVTSLLLAGAVGGLGLLRKLMR